MVFAAAPRAVLHLGSCLHRPSEAGAKTGLRFGDWSSDELAPHKRKVQRELAAVAVPESPRLPKPAVEPGLQPLQYWWQQPCLWLKRCHQPAPRLSQYSCRPEYLTSQRLSCPSGNELETALKPMAALAAQRVVPCWVDE